MDTANKMLAKYSKLQETQANIANLKKMLKAAECRTSKITALLDIYKQIKAIRKTWQAGAMPKLTFEQNTAAYKKVYDLQAQERKLQNAEEERVRERRPCV
jgi:uncharacterized lipoprotein YddW (UPF0748 family)